MITVTLIDAVAVIKAGLFVTIFGAVASVVRTLLLKYHRPSPTLFAISVAGLILLVIGLVLTPFVYV